MNASTRARPLVITALAACGLAVTAAAPLPTPPLAEPQAFARWWARTGTPGAAVGLARLAVAGGWAWLMVGAALVLRTERPPRLVPRWLRPVLLASSVGIASGGPAGAQTADPAGPRLVDLGPVPSPSPDVRPALLLRDLGSITTPEIDAESTTIHAVVDTWTVERGDHLWHIAEETLRDHGADPSERQVAIYWREVIAANAPTVGADPDLILPGQTIVLPPVQGV